MKFYEVLATEKELKNDEKQLKIEIANYMYGIGIPVCTRGNVYVREAIYLATRDRKLLHSLTKKLYPSVAKKYDTTSSKVERAIRYVIEKSFEEHKTELATNLFPLLILIKTNQQMVSS